MSTEEFGTCYHSNEIHRKNDFCVGFEPTKDFFSDGTPVAIYDEYTPEWVTRNDN